MLFWMGGFTHRSGGVGGFGGVDPRYRNDSIIKGIFLNTATVVVVAGKCLGGFSPLIACSCLRKLGDPGIPPPRGRLHHMGVYAPQGSLQYMGGGRYICLYVFHKFARIKISSLRVPMQVTVSAKSMSKTRHDKQLS